VRAQLLLVMVLLAGCAPASGPDVVEVRLTCDTGDPDAPCAFQLAEVTVRPGGAVRWVNDDATFHTVTSTDSLTRRVPNGWFDAVLDQPDETFSVTFDRPGSYPYYCQPHADFMVGTVHAVAS
jgi:plastocyanin